MDSLNEFLVKIAARSMIVKGWEGMKRGDIKIRNFIKSVFVSEEAGWEGEAKREGSD